MAKRGRKPKQKGDPHALTGKQQLTQREVPKIRAESGKGKGHTKLTPKRADRILECIRRGFRRDMIAYYAGISVISLRIWERRGRADLENGDDTAYARLVARWLEISAEQEAKLIRSIEIAGLPYALAVGDDDRVPDDVPEELRRKGHDWRAAAFLLERRHGWEKTASVTVSGKVEHEHGGQVEHTHGGTVEHVVKVYDLRALSPEQLRAIAYPTEDPAIDDRDPIVIDVEATTQRAALALTLEHEDATDGEPATVDAEPEAEDPADVLV
jgi:hypothetical protein